MKSPRCDPTGFAATAYGKLWNMMGRVDGERQTGPNAKLIACSTGRLQSGATLGGNAASSGASRSRAAGSALRNSFQLLDFSQLTRCHLHHQIQDRLLSDFANLYELHGAKSNPGESSYHPPEVAGILPHRHQEGRREIHSAGWPDTVLWNCRGVH